MTVARAETIKKRREVSRLIGKERGGWALRYFLDASRCSQRHGVSPENYLVLRFFDLSEAERETYLTSGRSKRSDAALNARASAADKAAAFLPVLDNLDRVLQVSEGADVVSVLKGVSMVREQFLSVILDMGIERVETVGKHFDPVRHEAVSTEPVAEEERDGVILEEYLPGYAAEERILRPARVRVGTYRKE